MERATEHKEQRTTARELRGPTGIDEDVELGLRVRAEEETLVGSTTKVIENASNDVGAPVKLTGFVRFELGEGIEKSEADFAAEVAATLNT